MAKKPPKFNPSRVWLDRAIVDFANSLKPGATVLDAGAGDQRYRRHFSHCAYESADFGKVDKVDYPDLTYVCDLAKIPVDDERFDGILFTQVMEHLPEPMDVLRELRRVLKPGGKILYSAPLYYEEHQMPYDFYRYTQFAVRHMFGKAGLEIEKLDWLEGYLATSAHQLKRMIQFLPGSPSPYYGPGIGGFAVFLLVQIFKPLAWLVSRCLARADARIKYTGRGHPKNYIAIAQKPAGGEARPASP